ncbi:MAG: hypothetical protein K9M54_12555 [Kiritimatiellales bacterium]|nr:hypothetical protein [Kiritimatiellales bacterium]
MKIKLGLIIAVCLVVIRPCPSGAAADVVTDIYGLEALFVDQQYRFLPIGPPSKDVLVQPYGSVMPVDWKKFPKEFIRQMYAEMDANGFPLYRVSVYEDPSTRETVFLNSYGTEVLRLAAESGYDPYAWQKAMFNLAEGQELDEWSRWIFDPAHIASSFTLIPEVFHESYLLAQDGLAAQELAMAPMSMMALSGGETKAVASMAMDTNGLVQLNLSLPEAFGLHVEIFQKDNLVYSPAWEVAAGWIPTYGNANVSWIDPGSSNLSFRFYLLSDADIDTDGDGFSDLREHYISGTDTNVFNLIDEDEDGLHDWWETKLFGGLGQTGAGDFDGDGLLNSEEMETNLGDPPSVALYTDPSLFDTDGDGLGDGNELLGMPPTDPLNDDAAPPVVFIVWPTNGQVFNP